MARVREIAQSRRGPAFVRREAERRARIRAVAWARAHACLSQEERGRRLHLAPSTLGAWEERWRTDHLLSRRRGRPPGLVTENDRRVLLALVALLGPRCSWETVSVWVPGVPRERGRAMLRRIEKGWTWAQRVGQKLLRWRRPGWVWTLDFTTPPHPVEGRYGKILLVRDLSSGLTLLSLACEDETARTLVDALRALFAQVGAPLVVKMDNGSAQRSGAMRALLREYGVIGLFSPPYTAKYNGAAEAGIGGLKTRAHHLASAAGRPEEWTLDDLEEARCLGNELGRPAGASAPTPEESWRGRVLPTPAERASFRTRVARTLRGVRHPGPEGDPGAPGRSRSDAARRTAISRALTDAGILEFRTRRIPQPVSTSKRPVFS